MEEMLKKLGIERQTLKNSEGESYLPGFTENSIVDSNISDAEYKELCESNKMISDGSDMEAEKRDVYLKELSEDSKMKMLHRERILTIKGSNETVDRHGDIVRVEGWDLSDYKKNPVFLWGHDYDHEPVGKALKVTKKVNKEKPSENALMFKIYFPTRDISEKADNVYKMYKSGILSATSVGFMPTEMKRPKDEDEREKLGLGKWGVEFTKQKLWELSAVTVPSNPDALVELSAEDKAICKSLGLLKPEKTVEKNDIEDRISQLEKRVEELTKELSETKALLPKDQEVSENKKDTDSELDSNESKGANFYDSILVGFDKAFDNETVSEEHIQSFKKGVQNG